METKFYLLSKIDDKTWLVIDKTNFFSNHYYKSEKQAIKKCKKIEEKQ